MKPLNQTIGVLSLIASVMALSSLVYGAFHEPLYPYMQGMMGGVMDVYRTMRDVVFAGLGWTFSGVINWIGQWLIWLPPAPRLLLPSYVKDAVTVYLMIGTAWSRTVITGMEIEHTIHLGAKPMLETAIKLLRVLFWPFEYLYHLSSSAALYFQKNATFELSKTEKTLAITRFISIELLVYAAGAALFFFLVYAENRIGF